MSANGTFDVPPGWKAVFNEEHQEWFYVNLHTNSSTWSKPTQAAQNDSATQRYVLDYSDKVAVPHSDLEHVSAGQQPVHDFYAQQVTSNGDHGQNTNLDDGKSGLEIEQEILGEYSYPEETSMPKAEVSAFSLKQGCKVVIKRYNKALDSDIARANREILALQAISDAAVPPLIDYFDPADTIFTVVEDRDDESLKPYIESRGSLSEAMFKAIITQLFSAVAMIFHAGFSHLRICDETLFIGRDGQLTVKGFEYAHQYQNEKHNDLYAAMEAKYGNDIYVAPEVFTTTPYNARKAMIWSCGVAAYYMTTGQTERLSNLDHPVCSKAPGSLLPTSDEERPIQQRRRSSLGFRRQSLGGRKMSLSQPPNIVTYPGSRFEVTGWIRDIISKMLIIDPRRRPELIEVAAKVPKEFETKVSRPLMEIAWDDYKLHAGPYAGLNEQFEQSSSASSIYSGISNFSNPFGSLMGGRSTAGKRTSYAGFV